jgi:NAD(P)-dependent dehydrogenase (short-subunit alcohol dehydrogenase family)
MHSEKHHGALAGLVALVTGGGTGIGRGIAVTFAREGASVAVTGRRKEPLEAVVAEIEKNGGKAAAITGDVSNPDDCHQMVLQCIMRFRHLHLLVNNAGMARFSALDQTTDEDVARMLDVNLRGVMLMTKYAIPELSHHREPAKGAILNIGSSAALSAMKNFAPYSAAKAGLIEFTRCMAMELAEARVRVNCINPGAVETPIYETMMPPAAVKLALKTFAHQTPLGRVGQPKDVADAALFLCSPAASWITGASLTVDGGLSLA